MTDGIRQVGLPHSATAVDEQGVERRVTGLLGDSQTGRAREFIRFARDERVKSIELVQLRVEVLRVLLRVHRLLRGRMRARPRRRQHGSCPGGRINQHSVFETGTLSEHAINSRGEKRNIILLNILRHKL